MTFTDGFDGLPVFSPDGTKLCWTSGRAPDGQYSRSEAHGFYWTASESGAANATFYNFGHGGLALYRQSEGEKQRAFSVRCVRD